MKDGMDKTNSGIRSTIEGIRGIANEKTAPMTSAKNESKPMALGRCMTVRLGCDELQSTQ